MVYSIAGANTGSQSAGGCKRTIAQGIAALPGPAGERSVAVLEHGTLQLKVYAPRGTDLQQPHTRDELYIVVHGTGEFVTAHERIAFAAGDALFVGARQPHRFENFSDDFVVWVAFYGPEGGE